MAAFGTPLQSSESETPLRQSCGIPYSQEVLDAVASFNFSSLELGMGTISSSNTTETDIDIDTKILQSIKNSNPNLGASDLFLTNHFHHWPRTRTGAVIIWYCYKNAGTRNELKDTFEEAIEIWYKGLGGKKSHGTGHAITFAERKGGPPPGLNPQPCMESDIRWNRYVPYDTLTIHWDAIQNSGRLSWASQGFKPHNGQLWQNSLHTDEKDPAVIAHELGHVLGMSHEHQRSDRDQYLRVDWFEMNGFREAWEAVQRDIPHIELKNFVKSYLLGHRYSSPHVQYIVGKGLRDEWPIRNHGPYDVKSITHYATYMTANRYCLYGDLKKCAVVKYRYPGTSNKVDVDKVMQNKEVSGGDADWVRHHYPWQD